MLTYHLNKSYLLVDVEQTAHASLEQQGRKKSQRKIKGGASRGAIGVTVLEWHEIWQVEGKRHSDPHSCYYCRQNLGKFLH